MNEKYLEHHFEKLVQANPNNGQLWLKYGRLLRMHEQPQTKVLQAFKIAQSLLPEEDLRLDIAKALYQLDETDEAINITRRHVEDNKSLESYLFFAQLLMRTDDLHEPIRVLQQGLTLHDDSKLLSVLLGECLITIDRNQAIFYFRRSVSIDPCFALGWRFLGSSLLFGKQTIEEGVNALKESIKFDSSDGWAELYLANGLWQLNRIEESQIHYRNAIELEVENKSYFTDCYNNFLLKTGLKG